MILDTDLVNELGNRNNFKDENLSKKFRNFGEFY